MTPMIEGWFYLAAASLVLLALAFVLWPLAVGGRRARAADREAEMRALYRDRVAEIEAETAAGQLDEGTKGDVVDELGANLLEEYRAAESEAPASDRQNAGLKTAFWLVLVLVPLGAAAVYFTAGEPDAPVLARASEVLRLDPDADRARIEAWSDRLARRVDGRPGDGRSWYLLGVSRLQLGEFEAAARAFSRAHAHMGSSPTLDVYWLQARYLAAGGRMDEGARELASRILEARPNHPLVLEMFAIDAFRSGDYRTAVEQLNRALSNELSPSQRDALMAGLEQARQRMGALSPTVDVEVAAPNGMPRDGTVFVIARPPGGGMPLAVVRRPAGELPFSVRLDDTVSMAGARLSGSERFQVVVRLSRSGSPAAAPGDWQWRSDVLATGEIDEPVTLEARLTPWRPADG